MKKAIVLTLAFGLLMCSCAKNQGTTNSPSDVAQSQNTVSEEVLKEIEQKQASLERYQLVKEAKLNLKVIAEGALSYYQTEHATDNTGTNYFTKQYPISIEASQIGPKVDKSTINKTYHPTPEMFGTDRFKDVWAQLYFSMSGNVHYTYYYISDGKSFVAKASASLVEECDSVFQITGQTDDKDEPTIGAIVDLSGTAEGKAECNTVRLPQ